MKARYFIKIPGGRGVGEQMVPVDPLKLHSGVITQLYEWDSQRQQHVPLLGTESWVNKGLDTSEMLQLWQEFIEQVQYAAANQSGVAADFTQEMLVTMKDMARLIQEIADGKLAVATKTLESIGFGLVQAAAVAASELARLEKSATQHAGLAETMVSIVVDQDERTVAEAEMLAETIDNGLRAYRALVSYESDLDNWYERIEPKSRDWVTLSQANSPWLREQLEWLAHDETGFCTRASHYLITSDEEAAEEIVEAVAEARKRTLVIRERLATAKGEWTELKAASEDFLVQHFGTDIFIQTIRKCRETVEGASQRGVDAYSIVTGLINDEEFQEWQSTLTNPDWQSLHAVSVRLREKVDALRRLLSVKPELNASDENILNRTNHYIERLEVALAEFGIELDEVGNEKTDEPDETPRDMVEVDHDRLEELYEQMLAIGAVKYCGPEQLRLGTPSSMLDILSRLDRLTPEELELYREPLEERLDNDSVFLDLGANRLAAWQEVNPSQAHWLKVKQKRGRSVKRFPMWKLVEQARDKGLSLCLRYGLDPVDIAKASEARKAEKRQNK